MSEGGPGAETGAVPVFGSGSFDRRGVAFEGGGGGGIGDERMAS